MLNVEGAMRAYLDGTGGAKCHVSVPENPPGEFVTVERTGGGDSFSAVHENPTVVVDCYGPTRAKARALAAAVDARVKAMPTDLGGVSRVQVVSSLVHYPDVTSGRERYESTYSITTYDYKEA